MRILLLSIFIISMLLGALAACTPPANLQATPTLDQAQLANPASEYCLKQGGKLEIRKDEQGNEQGICIFADGGECEEWELFRGECGAGRPLKLGLNVVEVAGLADAIQIDILGPKTASVDRDVSVEPRLPGMEIIRSITEPAEIQALVAPLDVTLPLVPPMRCPPSYELQFHFENGDVQSYKLGLCGMYGEQDYWQGLTIHPPQTFVSQFNALVKQ